MNCHCQSGWICPDCRERLMYERSYLLEKMRGAIEILGDPASCRKTDIAEARVLLKRAIRRVYGETA